MDKWIIVGVIVFAGVLASIGTSSEYAAQPSAYAPNLGVVASIKQQEGFSEKPYLLNGILHIGFGRNLTDNGITEDEANYLLYNDLSRSYRELKEIFPDYDDFSEKRQVALMSMIFQLGKPAFLGFEKTIAAIRAGDWQTAGDEIMDSDMFDQVPGRTAAIARMVREG